MLSETTNPVSDFSITPALVSLDKGPINPGSAGVAGPSVTHSALLKNRTVPVHFVAMGRDDFPGPGLSSTLTGRGAHTPVTPLTHFTLRS